MKKKEAAFIKYIIFMYLLLPFGVGLLFVFVRNLIVFIAIVMNANGFESSTIEIWYPFINGVKFGLLADLVGIFTGIPIMWIIWSKLYKEEDTHITQD